MEGIIKTLKLRELIGYGDLDKAVWPVTSTGAIFSSNNKSLEEILADLYSKIKNGGSGTGGNTGGNTGGDDGKDGKTYDYIPVFIYCHADSVPTSKPIGGSYNFTTNTLTPPSGWQNNYTGLDKPIYMSIGMACSKDGSTIEWSYPFVAFSDGSKGSDLPYQPVPESNYKTLFIYQHNTSQPNIPTGGSYSFDTQTLNPPDGWYTSKENLTYPVYMSVGFTSKDKNTIEWSYPVIIADKNGLGPGKNPGSALLKRTYVAVIYKQSDKQPNTPSASAGIVHFDTTPYTFDPPIGWSTDTALAVNDDTWCSIKAFYQTADNSYDNSATEWSTPVKANLTKLTLTEAEMDMIAERISVTSNDVETAFDTWINNTRNLETVAEKVTETTDFYSLTAGQLVTNSDFQLNVAKELITVSNYKDDVVQNASGKIVAEIKADSDGMLTEIAKNVVIEAKADKDNKDGLIMLVAKDVTDNIKSEIEVGTDDSGNGFIKAIANNIDFNSNAFKSIVTNATNGKVTAIMQDDDTISLIKKAANDKVTSLIMGDDYIKMVASKVDIAASKVDIAGSLNTIDLTINGGKSYFSKDGDGYVANGNFEWDQTGNIKLNNNAAQFKTDGSGQVANGNINWDKDGNLNLKGNIEANCLKYNIEELKPTVNNATITLDPIRDKCSMYLIIYNEDTKTALNTAKFMLPDNLKPGASFKIAATVNSELIVQTFGSLLTFNVATPSNRYIMGTKLFTGNTVENQAYLATKVELNYYYIYEFTYLGYNLWCLTGECNTFTNAFSSESSK